MPRAWVFLTSPSLKTSGPPNGRGAKLCDLDLDLDVNLGPSRCVQLQSIDSSRQQIGQLPLLQALFGTLLVPPAVVRETAPTVILPDSVVERALTQQIGPQILGSSLGPVRARR